MTKRTKIGSFTAILLLVFSLSAFAEPAGLADLQRAAGNFSSTIAESLPLNASLGLNWSDAHIGMLFPGLPPRFGVGVSVGATSIELSDMERLADMLGFGGHLPDMNRFPFPGYTAEFRIGGFFLPFDIGFKFGYLPSLGLPDFDINYFLIGGDIRYAILNRPFLPRISVAVGFNYMRGGIGGRAGAGSTFEFGGKYIEFDPPEVNLNWRTRSLDFRVQASHTFLIITPYLGIGVSYAWSRAGYEVNANVHGDLEEVNTYLRNLGLDTIDVSSTGISSNVYNNAFGLRAFGGMSLNLAVFRLDFTGMYSFLDGNFGGSIGFRFQL